MRVFEQLLATLCLCLFAAVSLHAQANSGEIRGVVKDVTGGLVPSASISAKHPATGLTLERVSDSEGRFLLPALQTGEWEITASIPGFSPQTRRTTLEIGRTMDLEFLLSPQGVSQTVAVVNTEPLLQTATAEVSDVIENREVVQIPINVRSFLTLAQLSDAVVLPPGGTRGDALQQAGALPNVGGQRSGHNICLVDGAKVTDELFNNLVINPSMDSIQEFKIQKSMYPQNLEGKPPL